MRGGSYRMSDVYGQPDLPLWVRRGLRYWYHVLRPVQSGEGRYPGEYAAFSDLPTRVFLVSEAARCAYAGAKPPTIRKVTPEARAMLDQLFGAEIGAEE